MNTELKQKIEELFEIVSKMVEPTMATTTTQPIQVVATTQPTQVRVKGKSRVFNSGFKSQKFATPTSVISKAIFDILKNNTFMTYTEVYALIDKQLFGKGSNQVGIISSYLGDLYELGYIDRIKLKHKNPYYYYISHRCKTI